MVKARSYTTQLALMNAMTLNSKRGVAIVAQFVLPFFVLCVFLYNFSNFVSCFMLYFFYKGEYYHTIIASIEMSTLHDEALDEAYKSVFVWLSPSAYVTLQDLFCITLKLILSST